MAGVTIGQIGGNPLLKCLSPGVIGEGLPLTKSVAGGGGLGDMMSAVMSGNMASILPNPKSFDISNLKGIVQSQLSKLTGAGGFDQVIGAITGVTSGGAQGLGLEQVLTKLQSAGSALLSETGITQTIPAHMNIAGMAGDSLPSHLSLDVVMGPLTSDELINDTAYWLPGYIDSVIDGDVEVEDAVASINETINLIDAVVTDSDTAINDLAAMADKIAAVSTLTGMFAAVPEVVRNVLGQSLGPARLSTVKASVGSHLRDPD